jgi:ABC-type phosphate transport system permease subunit
MEKLSKNKEFATVLVIVLFCIVLFWFSSRVLFLKAGFLIGFISVLSSSIASFIHKIWMKIAGFIGQINGTIFLVVIFFLVVFPLGLIVKLLGKSSIILSQKKLTYFKERNHEFEKKDLQNMW